MNMSDYAQLRRRAEQCRAEEMARLWGLLKQALARAGAAAQRGWAGKRAGRVAPATGRCD